MKDIEITGYQLALLLMGFIFGSTVIIVPVSTVRQDAWLAYILGWAGGFILLWMYAAISSDNPNKTLVEILKDCFGKYIGSFIAIMYIWYFIHLGAVVLRNFGEYMTITIYYETPQIFTMGFLALVVAYTCKKGLNIFGRAAEMLMPYLFFFVTLIFFLLISEYDTKNMFPMLENGIYPVLKASYSALTFPFGEVVLFLMIFPFYKQPQKLKVTTLFSLGIVGFLILTLVLRDLWTLGPDMIDRLVFPPSLSAELIPEITLDPLVAVNLLVGGWIKVGICIYAAALGITQLLNHEDFKPFVFPVTIITLLLSAFIYENVFEMLRWSAEVFPIYVTPFQIVIPLIILGITKFKNRKKKGKKQRNQRRPSLQKQRKNQDQNHQSQSQNQQNQNKNSQNQQSSQHQQNQEQKNNNGNNQNNSNQNSSNQKGVKDNDHKQSVERQKGEKQKEQKSNEKNRNLRIRQRITT